MKVQRSLQQTICLGCMLIFLAGCAAYGSTLATQPAKLPLGPTQASLPVSYLSATAEPPLELTLALLPVRELSGGQAITGISTPKASSTPIMPPFPSRTLAHDTPTLTPVACITITYTSTPTQTATAHTHIPPGLAKKTGTPTPHVPPGLAKKTGTPTPHIPPGQAKKTPTPTWTGSVLIEGGAWGIPGCAGQTIKIRVEFAASSPFGQVDEMRVGAADWEPFVPLKFYPHTVAPNWYYWGVSAQFRDEYGNLSPVYHDDISMEGMWCPSPSP